MIPQPNLIIVKFFPFLSSIFRNVSLSIDNFIFSLRDNFQIRNQCLAVNPKNIYYILNWNALLLVPKMANFEMLHKFSSSNTPLLLFFFFCFLLYLRILLRVENYFFFFCKRLNKFRIFLLKHVWLF